MQVNRRYPVAGVRPAQHFGPVGPPPDDRRAPSDRRPPGEWTLRAACAGDPDAMYVTGAAQHAAVRVCAGCPVRLECLAEALDARIEVGVWGGMTERQRRALLRRRPGVTSWRRLLETARAEHARTAGWLMACRPCRLRGITNVLGRDEAVRLCREHDRVHHRGAATAAPVAAGGGVR